MQQFVGMISLRHSATCGFGTLLHVASTVRSASSADNFYADNTHSSILLYPTSPPFVPDECRSCQFIQAMKNYSQSYDNTFSKL